MAGDYDWDRVERVVIRRTPDSAGDLVGAVDRLNRDKVALEQSMEAEEENIVNRLQVGWGAVCWVLGVCVCVCRIKHTPCSLKSSPKLHSHLTLSTPPPKNAHTCVCLRCPQHTLTPPLTRH